MKKQCALVTGGSKGIGKAISKTLGVDHNLHILVNYHSDEKAAQDTLDLLHSENISAELLKFNVSDREEVSTTLEKWKTSNPDKIITVLVNNAGVAKDNLLLWMTEPEWDSVIDTSLKGMFNLTQFVLKDMVMQKFGRIINISSLSGVKGNAGQFNYSAAKGGMISATKALAQEIGKKGITVNAVAPGFIKTEMVSDEVIGTYQKFIPAGRIGEPEEVADLVSFLASEKAGYINGSVININGGLYC
ncbi:MAG: SDR family oxidoreductase [Bacteroidetes bacterium]|nr:MAG: SDR family oxidoreductase [Bacteroidota bacterium]